MCGICGAFNVDGRPAEAQAVLAMRRALRHRGPDDEGEHFDGPLGFGFQRLSILDLEGGHQPMSTPDGRFAIVFNGEIYNHPALRRALEAEGARFATRSDTETILQLFAREGPACVARLQGMFAFAVYDRREGELTLARDPVGVKPLYYRFDGRSLVFSSEVRSLLAAGVGCELDPAGVLDYLAYGKVHAPRTILRDVLKLPPATVLRLGKAGLRLETYWRLPGRPKHAFSGSLGEAVDLLEHHVSQAVRSQLLSDVPVGAFLSGGVDSSLVAAMMVRHAGARVKTFSVGFAGAAPGVDESRYARQAAEHLGTEHHELMLEASVLSRMDESIGLLDEPIADSAILPTFLLSQHARRHVKVVLTGEGADELFAGYNRYKAAWLNQGLKRLPGWSRPAAAALARRLGKGAVFESLPIEDARHWARATASATAEQLKPWLTPRFWEASQKFDALEWIKDFDGMDHLNDALAFDLRTVLCDSLLMKVDKSSMRAGLEARVPFLDKALIEFAASLPASFKIRRFKGKYLLRLAAARHLPAGLVWRRKHGFIVPWEPWVRDGSNKAINDLLADPGFASWGVFDVGRLRLFQRELAQGSREVEAGLFFRVVILGLWLDSLRAGVRA